MQTHDLKCWPNYYEAVERGEKPFEVRRDDRGFQKGDILRLWKYDHTRGYHTTKPHGHERAKIDRLVTWVLTGGQFGVEPGYVVMGLAPLPNEQRATDDPA